MSLINKEISDFKVQAFQKKAGAAQGEFVEYTKDSIKGKWSVFFFYPADFTFVCPTELADLQEQYGEFQKIGCEIFGVSCDTHFVHKAWHETSPEIGPLEFAMLGDVNGVITNNFDNARPDSGLADRSTYLIDPDGIIQYIETTPEGVGRNAAELLRKVKAAQYVRNHPGEVCPAKWEEGEETLTPSFDLVGKI